MMKNKISSILLALVIAFGLWVYVITSVSPGSQETFYNIPVAREGETVLEERGLMITHVSTSTVNLTLSGTRKDLAKVNPGNITLKVDLSRIYGAGTHSLEYTPSYPGDVASNAFVEESRYPEKITFVVEERRTKIVPVEIVWTGTTPDGFMIDKENKLLDNTHVTVMGPASVADQINKAVITVDLNDRRESVSESYRYTLCNADGEPVDAQLITTNVEEVRLDVKIQRYKDVAITYELVEGGGAREKDVVVTLSDETIRVSGSDAVLAAMGDEILVGTIDLGDIQDTDLTYPVNLPAGVTNLSGVTSVDVKVRFVGLETDNLRVREFESINVPEGMTVELSTKYLELVVRGPAAAMAKLEEEDITVTVDFAGGIHGSMESYPVTITFPSGVKDVGAVGTYQVWATLVPVPDEPVED